MVMVHNDAGAKNASKRRRRKNTIVATAVCILLFLLHIAWNSAKYCADIIVVATVCSLLLLLHVAWNSAKYGDIVKVTQEAMAETGSVAVQHVIEDTDKFNLASSLVSYGSFDDVTDKHWKLLQKIAVEHVNHEHPDKSLTYNPMFDKAYI